MFTKILVPLDGSQLAERALEPALALAQPGFSSVVLLQAPAAEWVMLPEVAGGYAPVGALEAARMDAENYLAARRTTYATDQISIRARVIEGSAPEVIVETAADEAADLIVMSSHGYSGLTRWVLGSVAERVLHAAPCPVLVMRSPKPVRHVLIPLDGSPLAEHALAPGLEVARRLHAHVTLLRALPPVSAEAREHLEMVEHGLGLRLESDLFDEANDYLARIATAHRPAGVTLKSVIVTEHPAEAILTYVEHHAVDVIAISTHGYTGLKRWTYGSVTDKVVREARACSMLVVRPTLSD